MNRNKRMFTVVGIAILAATLATVGVYYAVIHRPAVQVEVPSAMVVVAAKPLELGARLTAAEVRVIAWPARNPIEGSFAKIEDVMDRGLVVPLAENEPIIEGKLAPKNAGAGLPPAIKPGMRAMSVKVNEVIGVAGFVVPGTKVDVLVTIRRDRDTTSLVVCSNVQVLTAGTRYDEAEAKKQGKAIASSVVTLMVTPSDAQSIALAATEGQLMLALRNPLDTDNTRPQVTRTAELMRDPLPPVMRVTAPAPSRVTPATRSLRVVIAAPPPAPEPRPKRIVQVVSAGKSETVTIQ